jgi:hypothetical protein
MSAKQTFGSRKGTPLYRRRTPEATIVLVLTLVAHGCPIAAIEAAFGLQRRTPCKAGSMAPEIIASKFISIWYSNRAISGISKPTNCG